MLKIKFWRIENFIVMKILKQGDEIERGNFRFKASNDIVFCSKKDPEICHTDLYLRGINVSNDNRCSAWSFATSEKAKEMLKTYIEAVKEYNNSLQQPAAEDVEDIETIIAE